MRTMGVDPIIPTMVEGAGAETAIGGSVAKIGCCGGGPDSADDCCGCNGCEEEDEGGGNVGVKALIASHTRRHTPFIL